MNRTEMLRRLKNGEDPLEVAIQKWQDIVDGKGEADGYGNCALCEVNHDSIHACPNLCPKCPVSQAGYDNCIGTPYCDYMKTERRTRKRFAKKELEFLKSLRKKEA